MVLIRESETVEDMVLYGSHVREDRLSVAEWKIYRIIHRIYTLLILNFVGQSVRMGQTELAESRF
jgi:hypothetical protein